MCPVQEQAWSLTEHIYRWYSLVVLVLKKQGISWTVVNILTSFLWCAKGKASQGGESLKLCIKIVGSINRCLSSANLRFSQRIRPNGILIIFSAPKVISSQRDEARQDVKSQKCVSNFFWVLFFSIWFRKFLIFKVIWKYASTRLPKQNITLITLTYPNQTQLDPT